MILDHPGSHGSLEEGGKEEIILHTEEEAV